MKILVACLIFACVSVNSEASRVKQSVSFDLKGAKTNDQILPFSAQVPSDFRGSFIRFINPKNGKSVVAKIMSRTGSEFRTSSELSKIIDIDAAIAIVFVEAVY